MGSARVDLTEEEAKSPIASKFLLNDVERLEEALRIAEPFRQNYADADKQAAVLQTRIDGMNEVDVEKQKNQTLADVCFGFGVGIGGVLLGITPSYQNSQVIVGLVGLALVGGGIAAKMVKK